MSTAEMLALVAELEAIATGGGYPDPTVTTRVKRICFSLRLEAIGWSEQLASAEYYAGVLYSVRKHDRVPGGVAGARAFLLGDCRRLRMKIAQHEAGSAGNALAHEP